MMFVAKLYVEGGEYDGSEFVVGPFVGEENAQHCANELDRFGSSDVLPLYAYVSDDGATTAFVSLLRMLDEGRNHVS